nr:hypothetical protein [Tanacetum cinerariifolium]
MSYDRDPIDQNDGTDDLDNELELLASLIEKLKCEIDDSKNRNKFLETSNKVLVEKLIGEIEDFKNKNKSLESSNKRFKEENNKLLETNKLLYDDFKKSEAELKRRNSVEYASKMEIKCAQVRGDLISYKMESQKTHQAATRKREKAIVNSPQLIYDQEPSMVDDDDETSKDKEIDKLMALISLSFKKIYKPTNNNLQTSSNTSRANQDNSLRIYRNARYEGQRSGNVAGARETVGSSMVQKSRIQCYNCKEYGHVAREFYHPQTHPTQYNQTSSTRTPQAATKNREKAIVNSLQPIYDQEPSMVDDDDETSKDKEIDKLMALISLSFKKIYKPTNNNLRTSSNTSRANQDNSPRIHRNAGYESQRSGNVAGAKETIGSSMVQKFGIQCYNCK